MRRLEDLLAGWEEGPYIILAWQVETPAGDSRNDIGCKYDDKDGPKVPEELWNL